MVVALGLLLASAGALVWVQRAHRRRRSLDLHRLQNVLEGADHDRQWRPIEDNPARSHVRVVSTYVGRGLPESPEAPVEQRWTGVLRPYGTAHAPIRNDLPRIPSRDVPQHDDPDHPAFVFIADPSLEADPDRSERQHLHAQVSGSQVSGSQVSGSQVSGPEAEAEELELPGAEPVHALARGGVATEAASSSRARRSLPRTMQARVAREDRRHHVGQAVKVSALAGLVAVAVLATVISHGDHPRSVGATAGSGTRSTTGSSPHSGTSRQTHPGSGGTTTATTPAALSPTTTTASEADFSVGHGSFKVTVTTSGPCWVQVKAGPSGPTLFEATLASGSQQTFDATNGLWVRLGAASNAAVSVDGSSLSLPALGPDPYNISLQA